MAALLQVEALDLYYGDAQALSQVSLEIAAGEIVAIVGANGAGKSSLIRAIHGIEQPAHGTVRFDGVDVTGWPSHRTCEAGLGHVAEGRQVFPNLTVLENLEMGAMPHRARASEKAALERVLALFPRLGERRRQAAGTLSGGEQQMLAIGRALMAEPALLILDEPSLGLSPLLVEELFALIKRINADGTALLLVEQNVVQSLEVAQRAYILDNGLFVLQGSAAEVRSNPDLKRAYLGL